LAHTLLSFRDTFSWVESCNLGWMLLLLSGGIGG